MTQNAAEKISSTEFQATSETPCCITDFKSNVAYKLLKRATEFQINIKDISFAGLYIHHVSPTSGISIWLR